MEWQTKETNDIVLILRSTTFIKHLKFIFVYEEPRFLPKGYEQFYKNKLCKKWFLNEIRNGI